jgi:hypothetical protein
MIIEALILKHVLDGRRSKKELKKQTKLMKQQNQALKQQNQQQQQNGDPADWRTRNPHSKTLEIGGTDLYGNKINSTPPKKENPQDARLNELRLRLRAGNTIGIKNYVWYTMHESTKELKITNQMKKQQQKN